MASRDQDEEISLKEAHKPFSSNSRGPIHEDQRLQVEEQDAWRTHKSKTHDKPKLCQNELNTFPNQLKVRDRVLLDATDPHIVTTNLNEDFPFMVLSTFPFGTVEGKDFSNMGYDTLPRPCDMAVSELAKTTRAFGTPVSRTRRLTCPCQATVAEPVKLTRAWAYIHRHGRSGRSQARLYDTAVRTYTAKEHGRRLNV
ncbi:hypothetical protein GOBAR_AA37986 [Gossypium barbadense]|uniref:Uncharacterized protein n=1 Tax=Gossypium barbadense TaxID=3634 RepID=A0A2P5VV59_GOSBA|nr:hypothetical protein GOBAR_AA37986 [Gossypium barbadense]